MPKVDTNTVSLLYKREAVAGTVEKLANKHASDANSDPDATHVATEPNEIGTFGATIETTAREPISNRLQRQKGAVTNLTAAADFSADLTMSAMLAWIGPAIFARWQNAAHRDLAVDGGAGKGISGGDGSRAINLVENVPLEYAANTLLWLSGFGGASNNGLQRLRAAAADGSKLLPIQDNYGSVAARKTVAEATAGKVTVCGFQIAAHASQNEWAWSSAAREATLTTSMPNVTAIKQLLKKGQFVHFGSVSAVNGALQTGLMQGGVGGETLYGFARYTGESTGTTLVFDRVSPDLQEPGNTGSNSDVLGNAAIDIIYGDFIKNVATTDDLYDDAAFTLALLSTELFGTPDSADRDKLIHGVEYAAGAKVGNLALQFALNDKATFSASFVARDVRPPEAAAPVDQLKETANDAYSTVADFARLRMDVDAEGIDSDFKSLTITLNPQISPENVIGKLGARYVNRGNLQVTAEAEVIFASDLIPKTLRENTTASFDAAIANDNGVLIFDVPSLTIGGGGRSYPANAAVTITGTGDAFEDAEHGASIMVSQFPVPIPVE